MCQNAHFLNQFQSGAAVVDNLDGIDDFLVAVNFKNFVDPLVGNAVNSGHAADKSQFVFIKVSVGAGQPRKSLHKGHFLIFSQFR